MNWEKFWDRVHREGDGFWLTDTPPEDYIRNLKLEDDLERARRIMEIGPGRGLMVRHLLERGHPVLAVDISNEALVRLPDATCVRHIDGLEDEEDDACDLGISYLTLQHVNHETATYIIKHAVRICGVFKFQMASLIDRCRPIAGYSARHAVGGPLFMHELRDFESELPKLKFKWLGGQPHPAQNIAWHFVEAR